MDSTTRLIVTVCALFLLATAAPQVLLNRSLLGRPLIGVPGASSASYARLSASGIGLAAVGLLLIAWTPVGATLGDAGLAVLVAGVVLWFVALVRRLVDARG